MLKIFTTNRIQNRKNPSIITVEHTKKNQSFVTISDWLSNVDSPEEEKEPQVTVLLKLNLNEISDISGR
ncbi:MAG: hypothetical protein CM1200mP28_05880 [Deltaproteobacteria bacterium]|nr:MAG: hypothetical protein CM1200mP28_05880 [Deltaproteobacteria bacterium]